MTEDEPPCRRAAVISIGLGLGVVAVLFWYPKVSEEPGVDAVPSLSLAAAVGLGQSGGPVQSSRPSARASDPGTRPPSARAPRASAALSGTGPDGALRVGPDGALRLEPSVRRLFDHFLLARGEWSEQEIRDAVVEVITRALQAPAADEALALFDAYVAYLAAGAEGSWAPAGGDLAAMIAARQALRVRFLGSTAADALFADEASSLSTLRDRPAPGLPGALAPSPGEDRAEPSAAPPREDALPPEIREARAAVVAPSTSIADEATLRAQGASDADIRAYRAERFGEEAAARLESLDRAQAAWSARVAAFREACAGIAADGTVDRRAAVQALRDATFTPVERMRLPPDACAPR